MGGEEGRGEQVGDGEERRGQSWWGPADLLRSFLSTVGREQFGRDRITKCK